MERRVDDTLRNVMRTAALRWARRECEFELLAGAAEGAEDARGVGHTYAHNGAMQLVAAFEAHLARVQLATDQE